jgi:hypothetical protein
LSKSTILWHKNVMRVGAVDCAAEENIKLCRYHKVELFPTFYMFEAHVQKTRGVEASYTHKSEQFQQDMINFLEVHPNKPAFWPKFNEYE